MPQKINIADEEYEVIDAKERITVPDCFVGPHNKIGTGHGEAKLYLGQRKDDTFTFFDNLERTCFFIKSDIINYLNQVKLEYFNPQQPYRKKEELRKDWGKYYKKAHGLPTEIMKFSLEFQGHLKGPRFYLNSKNFIYLFLRKISLPNITYLSALKLKNKKGDILYYFKLFVDYFGEEALPQVIKEEESEIESKSIKDEIKEQIVIARKGQGKYRKGVLNECPFCPITLVSDDRLLIASHIKPWVKSNDKEKTDPKNGFMFTPTYDFMFDRGFISFRDDKTILISPWLSKMTLSKLNLKPDRKYNLLLINGREKYLEYHRKNIFKGGSS